MAQRVRKLLDLIDDAPIRHFDRRHERHVLPDACKAGAVSDTTHGQRRAAALIERARQPSVCS